MRVYHRRLLLGVAGAVVAVVLAAGCTRVGGGRASSGNPWTHHGVLRMANLSEPDSLNPLVGNFGIDSDLAMFWGGYLFNFDDRGNFVPELATAVPTLANRGISPDGRTIAYHLRPGVLWQDGRPFGADDVIFTWRAVMNPRNNVSSRVGFDDVAAVDKRDAHTIVVHLRRPYAPFVATFFAQSASPYPVLPAHLLARYSDLNRVPYNSRPVGTGPFVVERWQHGHKIVFRANPHYWRGPPKLHEIDYEAVPNENTIVTLMRSHEIDLEYDGSTALFAQYRAIPGTHYELVPFTQYTQIGVNTRAPLVSDVRVRRALWYALDVKRLIHEVSHDVAVVGHTDQPSFSWAYDPNVPHYDYNPTMAGRLLDQAGWKPGPDGIRTRGGTRLSLTFVNTAGSATGNAVFVIAQRDWQKVGVEVLIKNYAPSLFFAPYEAGGIIERGKFDLESASWANGTDPDDSASFTCDQVPPAGQNIYGLCDHAVDAAERIALSSYDLTVRKKAYATIQLHLAQDVPLIVVWFDRRLIVMNTDLKNFRPAHAVTEFWNTWEWQI